VAKGGEFRFEVRAKETLAREGGFSGDCSTSSFKKEVWENMNLCRV
jgi:hypothetical protein